MTLKDSPNWHLFTNDTDHIQSTTFNIDTKWNPLCDSIYFNLLRCAVLNGRFHGIYQLSQYSAPTNCKIHDQKWQKLCSKMAKTALTNRVQTYVWALQYKSQCWNLRLSKKVGRQYYSTVFKLSQLSQQLRYFDALKKKINLKIHASHKSSNYIYCNHGIAQFCMDWYMLMYEAIMQYLRACNQSNTSQLYCHEIKNVTKG